MHGGPVLLWCPNGRRWTRKAVVLVGVVALAMGAFLLNGAKGLEVGLRVDAAGGGRIGCVWTDRDGAEHTVGFKSIGGGAVSFRVPARAAGFHFVFLPSPSPYHVRSLTVFGVPVFSAQWLNNMVSPDQPVYTAQYMGARDSIGIRADQARVLAYVRLFGTMLAFARVLRVLGATVLLGVVLAVAGAEAARRGVRGHGSAVPFKACLPRARWTKRPMVMKVSLLLVALFSLPPPVVPVVPGFDASWCWLLNRYALDRSVVGESVFFTYGPLGFTFAPQPIGANVLVALVFNVMHCILWVAVLLAIVARFRDSQRGVGAVVLCTVLLPSGEWRWATLILAILMLCCLLPARDRRTLFGWAAMAGALSVHAGLIKFTLAVVAGLVALAAFLHILVFDRRKLTLYATGFCVGAFAWLGLARAVLFRSFESIATWALVSWEIAVGYGNAMVTQVTWPEVLIPSFLVACYIPLLFPLATKGASQRLGLLALVSPMVFFAFKYSMTRAGVGCIRASAYVLPCVTAMLLVFADPSWRRRAACTLRIQLAVGLAVFVLTGFFLGAPVLGISPGNFVDTVRLRRSVERAKTVSREALRASELPEDWLARIGSDSFTAYPNELTYAPANGLDFRPFPVLQGYSAYSLGLDRLGSRLFESDDGPTWILAEFDAMDQRNVMLDTPAVWNAIRSHYAMVGAHGRRLFLRRVPGSAPAGLKPLGTRVVRTGEWVDLSGVDMDSTYASIEWPPTLAGRFLRLLLRNTTCSLVAERSSGQSRRFRLVPETVQTPFPVGRIPFDDAEFLKVFDPDSPALPVRRLRFDCEIGAYYSAAITLSLYQLVPTAPELRGAGGR